MIRHTMNLGILYNLSNNNVYYHIQNFQQFPLKIDLARYQRQQLQNHLSLYLLDLNKYFRVYSVKFHVDCMLEYIKTDKVFYL